MQYISIHIFNTTSDRIVKFELFSHTSCLGLLLAEQKTLDERRFLYYLHTQKRAKKKPVLRDVSFFFSLQNTRMGRQPTPLAKPQLWGFRISPLGLTITSELSYTTIRGGGKQRKSLFAPFILPAPTWDLGFSLF